jgi:hypothetical protein
MAKKIIWLGMLIMVLVFGMSVVGCDLLDSNTSYSSPGYYNPGSQTGGEKTYTYTFHNESTYVVTVQLIGVTTFVLTAKGSKTVNNVPDDTDFKITPPSGKTATWDSAGSNIYIYVY